MILMPDLAELRDADSFLKNTNWARTVALFLEFKQNVSVLPFLRAVFSHPQCRITNLLLSPFDVGGSGDLDQVLKLLMEPIFAKLKVVHVVHPKMNLIEMELLGKWIGQGSLTALSLRVDLANEAIVRALAAILSLPGHALEKLTLAQNPTTMRWVLPMEILEAISNEHSSLTWLALDSGTLRLDGEEARLILKSKLTSLECALVSPEGLEFWSGMMETPGNKLEALRLVGNCDRVCSPQCITQALVNPHCKLERLCVEFIRLSNFNVMLGTPKIKILKLMRLRLPKQEWMEFVRSLRRYECLTTLDLRHNAEFVGECGALLADWMESGECKLRGEINLEHSGMGAFAAGRLIDALRHPNCLVEDVNLFGMKGDTSLLRVKHADTVKCMRVVHACLALRSAAQIKRLGAKSAVRRLPQELTMSIAACFVLPKPRNK